jgi:hypothetical protein
MLKRELFLAGTNLLGIFPIMKTNYLFERCLIVSIVLASIAMHIFVRTKITSIRTIPKQQSQQLQQSQQQTKILPHSIISSKIDFFLNMNRGSAIISILYFFPRWWSHNERGSVTVLLSSGLIFSLIGELVKIVPIYIICHSLWHLTLYSTIYHLLD